MDQMDDGRQFENGHEPRESIKTTESCVDDNIGGNITTRILRFLSAASPEALGGIALGLAACTYFVLGRVGLFLIGGIGGVALHATWERKYMPDHSLALNREQSLDIVKRLLDLRGAHLDVEDEAYDYDDDKEGFNEAVISNSLDGFRPETAAALNELVDAVIRDYVKWWYQPILPKDTAFPATCRHMLARFFLSLSNRLSRKRPADTFLDVLTNSSSIIIVFLNELSNALALSQGRDILPAEAIQLYLSASPDSSLANVLNPKQQTKKLKMIADDVLQNFLDKSAYDCPPAKTFLREAFAGLVLETTLKSCSKPEWINGWIVYLLEEGEPDFNQAIDAGVGSDEIGILDSSNTFFDLDGNHGNIALAKTSDSQMANQKQEAKRHRKRLSRAEEAMEEAMEEAKRLSELIAKEDARRAQMTRRLSQSGLNSVVETTDESVATIQPSAFGKSETQAAAYGVCRAHQLATSGKGAEEVNSRAEHSSRTSRQPQKVSPGQDSASLNATFPSTPALTGTQFTKFEQLVQQSVPVALLEKSHDQGVRTSAFTLHNANIIIHDDASGDKGRLRNKPNVDYLVQIEPASSEHPGFMIVRRYPDFETLHEVLRRIALISGVTAFTEQHNSLPNWKAHTKASLRGELERYLRDACWYQPLAESEGMKRFLEKDQAQPLSGLNGKPNLTVLAWPTPSAFETMGKGVLDVLTSAPKGVAEGGKVIGGGLTGVFTNIGNLGQKKAPSSRGTQAVSRSTTFAPPRMDSMNSITSFKNGRDSEDSLHPPATVHTQPTKTPTMERRPSYNSIIEDEIEEEARLSFSARTSLSGRQSTTHSRDPSRVSSRRETPLASPVHGSIEEMRLPPPPSDIPDDYGSHAEDSSAVHSRAESIMSTTRTSTSTAPSQQSPGRSSLSVARTNSTPAMKPARKPRREPAPLTEQETRVAVELLFAVVNELYTLSSAWNIRRTLLTAAKTFLLRPGNPSLTSIQSLIQDSVIASNTSDAGIAAHLRKLRENSLPTEDELRAWPTEMTLDEKERLRVKARKLLIERGVPTALTGVMGQAATGEALGRVFDCLQVEEVLRGLMFGLLLQGIRATTQ